MKQRSIGKLLCLCWLLSFSVFLPARAVVLSECTDAALRAALQAGGLVQIPCGGEIVLTNELVIARDTTLEGPPEGVTLRAGGTFRIMHMQRGTNASLAVALRNLTITGGTAPMGSGLYMENTDRNFSMSVALERVTFTNNLASGRSVSNVFQQGRIGGGAILSELATVTVTNCLFTANRSVYLASDQFFSGAKGGAISAFLTDITVDSSRFDSNLAMGTPIPSTQGPAEAHGGAIYGSSAHLFLNRCIFDENRAQGGNGLPGSITGDPGLQGGAWAYGGAVACEYSAMDVSDSLFTNNIAHGGEGGDNAHDVIPYGGSGYGGAIRLRSANISATNCTFLGNLAVGGSGNRGADATLAGSNGFDGGGGGAGVGGAVTAQDSYGYDFNWTYLNCTFVGNSCIGGSGGKGGAGGPAGPSGEKAGNGGKGGTGGWGEYPALYLLPVDQYGKLMFCTFSQNNIVAAEGGAGGNPGEVNGPSAGVAGQPGDGGISGGWAVYVERTPELRACIFVSSVGIRNAFIPDGMIDDGFNNSSDDSINFTAPTSVSMAKILLGSAGDYGGPVPTVPLLAGSAGVDVIPLTEEFPATDARGVARPVGGMVDAGAFEGVLDRFISTTRTGNTLRLGYPRGDANHVALDTSANLLDWTPVATNSPTGNTISFDVNAGTGAAFFRARKVD